MRNSGNQSLTWDFTCFKIPMIGTEFTPTVQDPKLLGPHTGCARLASPGRPGPTFYPQLAGILCLKEPGPGRPGLTLTMPIVHNHWEPKSDMGFHLLLNPNDLNRILPNNPGSHIVGSPSWEVRNTPTMGKEVYCKSISFRYYKISRVARISQSKEYFALLNFAFWYLKTLFDKNIAS